MSDIQEPDQPHSDQSATDRASADEDAGRLPENDDESPAPGDLGGQGAGDEPLGSDDEEDGAVRTEQVTGRRVTTRTTNRREVTEHTEETITEDIPLEAYQGPGSAHPAPVG